LPVIGLDHAVPANAFAASAGKALRMHKVPAVSRYPDHPRCAARYFWYVNAGMSENVRAWCSAAARSTPRLWREPWPQLRSASSGLDIPLTPSPLARRAAWTFLGAHLGYTLELAWLGHLPTAAVVVLPGSCLAWLWWGRRRDSPGQPRRLLIAADGRLHLLTVAGTVQQVTLHPSSLRLGPWLLLVFTTAQGQCRQLLGPDNLPPHQLAALRRRVLALAPDAVTQPPAWLQ
jgi:hypothetical protein